MKEVYLLADVGGTNARFILTTHRSSLRKKGLINLKSRDFNSFSSLLLEVLSYFKLNPRELVVCIALAGPVFGGRARLTNLGWEIDVKRVQKKFQFKRLIVVNDLLAGAVSLVSLKRKELKLVKEGRVIKGVRVAVFCGTGLGVGVVVKEKPLSPLSTEAGHITFQVLESLDLKLMEFLNERGQEIGYEEVLSGRGLENVYEFLHEERFSAPEIVDLAKKGDRKARQALRTYFTYLGRFCSQLGLCYLPLGGIYLGGGVVKALSDFLCEDEYRLIFIKNFLSSKRLNFLLEKIPVFAIEHPFPVLLGCKTILESLEA